MKNIIKILPFFLVVIAWGCFSTRDPESPELGQSSYQPPTSSSIVLSNFQNAVKEKNTENYVACFADGTSSMEKSFLFVPSSNALALYPSIFNTWTYSSENQYFFAMKSQLDADTAPILTLLNVSTENLMPDSVTYVMDYVISVASSTPNYPTTFAGTMQLSMYREQTGFWSIYKWIDAKSNNDSIQYTWSNLKAIYCN